MYFIFRSTTQNEAHHMHFKEHYISAHKIKNKKRKNELLA